MTIAAPALTAEHALTRPAWLRSDALCVAGFASLVAGAIHATAIGIHNEHDQAMVMFAVVAGFQLVWGVLAAATRGVRLALVGAAGNLALVGGWIMAKRTGIGFIDGLEEKEPIEFADALAAGLAALAVVAAVAFVFTHRRVPGLGARIAVGGACLALVGMAVPAMAATARMSQGAAGATTSHHAAATTPTASPASAVPAVPFEPTKPIDLGGIPGVTPEQQARAENLLAGTLTHLPVYADPATAEAAGYQSIQDGVTGYEHYINPEYMNDGRVLDPDRAESLVYQVRGGTKQLVAAMYMAEPGTTLETVPELGGPLTQWHIHDNLCFAPSGSVAGLTNPDGSCNPGLVKPEPVPMIHTWIVPNPCGPFAALKGIAGGSIPEGEERLCDTAHGGH